MGYVVAIRIQVRGDDQYRVATKYCQESQHLLELHELSHGNRRLDGHDIFVPGNQCTLTVELLKGIEYGLYEGDSVWAYVQARNKLGNSLPSAVGNGAVIPRRPDPPEAPTLVDRGAEFIQVTWELGFDGGSPITSCSIWWLDTNDLGATEQGPFQIPELAFVLRNYTAYNLTSGHIFRFKAACSNIAGISQASLPSYFMAGIAPNAPILL